MDTITELVWTMRSFYVTNKSSIP